MYVCSVCYLCCVPSIFTAFATFYNDWDQMSIHKQCNFPNHGIPPKQELSDALHETHYIRHAELGDFYEAADTMSIISNKGSLSPYTVSFHSGLEAAQQRRLRVSEVHVALNCK
jgi:hypothetical protein